MTGEKNRFKTTEKLWNLDDKQLKTPKHDALVLWLMDIDNLVKYTDLCNSPNAEDIKIESEVPIYSNKNFIGGYVDLIITIKCFDIEVFYLKHVIEVKPHIDSFGSVLRQIKSYKSFVNLTDYKGNSINRGLYGNGNFYLFTLDNRFDKQFESQGIKVLHPPEDFDIDEYMNKMGLK